MAVKTPPQIPTMRSSKQITNDNGGAKYPHDVVNYYVLRKTFPLRNRAYIGIKETQYSTLLFTE